MLSNKACAWCVQLRGVSMLNSGTLKTIANSSPTANTIFEALSKRERFRERITLKKFKYDLIKSGQKVVDQEFLDTFKKLEEAGVGSLVKGRGSNPDRFVWNFNLRDVGTAAFATNEKQELPVIKHRRKIRLTPKPVPSSNLLEEVTAQLQKSSVQVVINVSSRAKQEDVQALISLAQELGK